MPAATKAATAESKPETTAFNDIPSFSTQSISSSWQQTKQCSEGSSQTLPLITAEAVCQVVRSLDVDVQTDPEPVRPFKLANNYDRGTMVAFLGKVESFVSAQLLQNVRSTAFDGWSAHWEDSVTSTTLLHTLDPSSRLQTAGLLCSDLSWNKNGTTVAVAYGRFDHESWCQHSGALCTWSLATRTGAEEVAFEIETESCLMCIGYHPTDPSLIAGGTFNGHIFVCRTNDNEEDPYVAISRTSDFAHQEPVAKISWVPGFKPGQYQIMSIGNDGKVLTWDLGNKLVAPLFGAQLSIGNIPRHLRRNPGLGGMAGSGTQGGNGPQTKTSSAPPRSTKNTDAMLGGTGIAFPPENSTVYMVATEAGFIAKCARPTALTLSIAGSGGQPPTTTAGVGKSKWPNPIQFCYHPHTGPVNSIACSPFHRNLFATVGSDGLIQVYNMLQSQPVLTLDPSQKSMFAIEWSPVRATAFACASGDGLVYVYDLATNTSLPYATLSIAEKSSISCTTLAFSGTTTAAHSSSLHMSSDNTGTSAAVLGSGSRHPPYLATGDNTGQVKIWRLSSQLASANEGWELRAIDHLVET
ncbi:WD40-repeat-containing domain protein [Phlyctochytrium arcticum]|nr:WD40-repeat-containing domain protein [Phlyctochytrium arcticum]